MTARREITKKYAREYQRASKKQRGVLLDGLCQATGWSRDNARRAIRNASVRRGAASQQTRKARGRKYSYGALKVLIEVWTLVGEPCGKYFSAIMEDSLTRLVRHGELKRVSDRLTDQVWDELIAMSPATIDRYLAPTRAARYPEAKSATRAGNTLRSQIKVRKAGDEMEQRPGFLEIDLVAHCGHTLKGEFLWTLTATDVFLGWTINVAIKNRASKHVIAAMDHVAAVLPYPLTGLDMDNGSEFINYDLVAWCEERDIAMTRARPYKHNDNAHVEHKNGAVVRREAFRYRYETAEEMGLLNELWHLVNLRKNYLLPTVKATGWRQTKAGRKARIYDTPATPYQRLIDSGTLDDASAAALDQVAEPLNPAEITRRVNRIQQQLIASAKARTQAGRAAA
ncbi:MAG: integrase catalytic domain-containing protein [Tepidiformaceae bacterium]